MRELPQWAVLDTIFDEFVSEWARPRDFARDAKTMARNGEIPYKLSAI